MIKYKIEYSLDPQTIENFSNNIGFLDKNIKSFKIDNETNTILLELNSNENQEHIISKISELAKKLRPLKELPTKVIFSNIDQITPNKSDVYSELIEKKQIFQNSLGYYSITGIPLQMMEALDRHLRIFAQQFKAQEILLPVSTSLQDLKDAHFFKRTPQHANFISLLKEESETIGSFCKTVNENNSKDLGEYFNRPQHICRSAVCSNSYPIFKNKILNEDNFCTLSTVGRVFRNESKAAVQGLERLFEFTVRDFIFLGDKSYVKTNLTICLDWFKNFLKDFKIKGVLQTAGDPFYADNAKTLQFYQISEESKLEFRLLNPFNNLETSCGSINNHGPHFAKSYNIKLNGNEYATTGCVGFGYERLIFLVLSQYGLDYKKWPTNLRDFFFSI